MSRCTKKCSKCNTWFSSKSYLNKHLKTCNVILTIDDSTNEISYMCKCEKEYKRKKYYDNHIYTCKAHLIRDFKEKPQLDIVTFKSVSCKTIINLFKGIYVENDKYRNIKIPNKRDRKSVV